MDTSVNQSDQQLTALGERIEQKERLDITGVGDLSDIENYVEELRDDPYYHTERTIIEFATQLCELMRQKGISKEVLADKIERPVPWVQGVMSGSRSVTIRHMIEVLMALDCRLKLEIVPSKVPHHYDEPTEKMDYDNNSGC